MLRRISRGSPGFELLSFVFIGKVTWRASRLSSERIDFPDSYHKVSTSPRPDKTTIRGSKTKQNAKTVTATRPLEPCTASKKQQLRQRSLLCIRCATGKEIIGEGRRTHPLILCQWSRLFSERPSTKPARPSIVGHVLEPSRHYPIISVSRLHACSVKTRNNTRSF